VQTRITLVCYVYTMGYLQEQQLTYLIVTLNIELGIASDHHIKENVMLDSLYLG